MPDLPALGAVAALLLVPGLLAVRASWAAVPFLSAGFWIVSCVWLPEPASGRTRFILLVIGLSGLLAAMRLAKGVARPRIGAETLLVAAVALLRLAPSAYWEVAPGAEMSLHSLETRLYVWRDGLPRTYEPLFPVHAFGAHPPGLHVLAGDVALLTGAEPARAALWIALASHGLLVIALFALLRAFFEPAVAARAAAIATALTPVPQAFVSSGANASVLALAFVVAGATLLRAHRSDASAVAAGLPVAAAMLCDPPIALWAAAAGGGVRRWGLMAGTALATALPFLLRRGAWEPTPLALTGVLVVPVALAVGGALVRVPARLRTPLVAVLAAAALAVSLRMYFLAAPDDMPGASDLAAMRRIEANTRVTDVVCHGGRREALWIPAIAGRGIDQPHLPAAYRDELRRRSASRPCRVAYDRRP